MKFNKLRKFYRRLFPLKISESERFYSNLMKLSSIRAIEYNQGNYFLTTEKDNILNVRNERHSDYLVYRQIFENQEYLPVLKIIDLNNIVDDKCFVMIDAGANVGYTTVYFANHYKKRLIIGVEPSLDNFEVYKMNTKALQEGELIVYNKALSHSKGIKYNLDREFRDGKDWGITTTENEKGIIDGITIQEIIEENKLSYITLLKIDIEGAERFILTKENDLSFLDITYVLAVEIHDEFNCRENIYELLKSKGFILLESRELTIALNKDLICRK